MPSDTQPTANQPSDLRGCPHCGLVQHVPAIPVGTVARCTRCSDVVLRSSPAKANALCAALCLAALICYPLGVFLPVLQLETLGHTQQASIWGGSISLITSGQLFVGLVVLACSVVIPAIKLAGLLVLTSRTNLIAQRKRAHLYRWIELIGRWGMIDVLLVAMLVAAVKLGDIVSVQPGPGVAAFAAVVTLSLAASAAFDPHAIWETPSR